MECDTLKKLIESELPECEAIIEGDGSHFFAKVVSPIFAGKSRVAQQQLVYQCVNASIASGDIHALSIKTFTPETWQQQNKQD